MVELSRRKGFCPLWMVVGIAVAGLVLAFPAIEEDVAVHAAADLTSTSVLALL